MPLLFPENLNYCINNLQVLVDPCGGRGWKWVEGAQGNMFTYEKSKRFPGVRYYVCRLVPIQIQYIVLVTLYNNYSVIKYLQIFCK